MPAKAAMERWTGSARQLLEFLVDSAAFLYVPNAESQSTRIRRRTGSSMLVDPELVADLERRGFIRRDRCCWLLLPAGRAWLNG